MGSMRGEEMTKSYQMLIGGDWVDASDGGTFTTANPATGEDWARVPEATAEDVDRAVRAAHVACYEGPWSRMTAKPYSAKERPNSSAISSSGWASDTVAMPSADWISVMRFIYKLAIGCAKRLAPSPIAWV